MVMHSSGRRARGLRPGFTVIEIMVAVLIVVIGLLALVGSGTLYSAMLSRGNSATRAAFFGQDHIERLRATPCQLLANGTATYSGGYLVDWTVENLVSGTYRRAQVRVRYPGRFGVQRQDIMEATILCIR
jgi:prepilin-type N-terminal cleavage/methylation domain-containing protein